VVVIEADSTGWWASATHEGDENVSCAVQFGDVADPPTTSRGHVAPPGGEIICEPMASFDGPVGEGLLDYYQRLKRHFR